jgi:hypothetical protein
VEKIRSKRKKSHAPPVEPDEAEKLRSPPPEYTPTREPTKAPSRKNAVRTPPEAPLPDIALPEKTEFIFRKAGILIIQYASQKYA